MHEELKQLGLSYNSIQTYQSLLTIGETTVGPLINDLKIHRQSVYNALEELEEKGMIAKTNINKVNHYRIADPDILIENAKKQELVMKRLSKSISEQMKKSRHEREINIYDGAEKIRQFFSVNYKNMPDNSTLHAIYATGKVIEEIVGIKHLKKLEKIRQKKNIFTKHIASEALRDDVDWIVKELGETTREIRYLSQRLTNPVTTVIWHNSVSYQIFGAAPFIIEIVNEEFHKTFLDHFKTLWQIAKK